MSNYYNDQWRLPNNENKDKQSNYSIQSPGTNARINISSPANVGITSSFAFWLKRTSSTAISQTYRISTGGVLYGMYMNGTTAIYVRYGGSPITINNTATLNALALTDWVHWVITREEVTSTTQDIKLYANGSLIYSLNGTSTLGTYDSEIDYLMWSLQTTDFMDSFSIFNYALTDGTGGTVNQIAALYGSSSTGIGNPMSLSPKPVAYYPLGDQDAFNGADYLVPNSSLKDYVFDFGTYTDNKYISINNTFDSIITGTNFTISSWINLDSVTSSQLKFIFTNEILQLTITDKITTYLRGASGYFLSPFDSNTTLTTGEWYNVVLIKSGSDYTYYLNGSPDGTVNNSTSVVNSAETTSRIGMYYNGSTYGFDGELSNIQIFNTALPATGSNSVETLYNNGSPLTSMSGFTSLQGWWKLDASATYDSSTTTWTIPDDSTNSNDGTSSGMTQANLVQSDLSFTSGYSPYALDFDGANDYINFTGLPDFGGGSLSISFWIKSGIDSSNAYVLMRSGFSFYIFQSGTASNLKYRIQTSSLNSINGGPILDNNWHNCVMTFDSTANEFKVFEDGNQVGSTVTTSGSLASSTSPVYLASFATGAPFKSGSFSNLSMWNTALTSSQVTEIYNEGVPSNLNNHSAYSNLVSWWQLGSNTSWVDPYWIALDEKGTNNGQSQNVAAPNNMGENAIVDGVGSYANGLSSGMGGDEVIGDAPYSSSNSLSVNMDVEDRVEDTPS